MVAAGDARVLRVHRQVLLVDRAHDRQPGVEQTLLLGAVERQPEVLQPHHRVEVAAEGEVVGHRPEAGYVDRGVEPGGERRHVGQRDGPGGAVLDGHLGHDQPGRGVQPDRGDRLGDLDHPGLDQHGGHADRAVPAHRQAAGDLDVEHSPVRVGPGRGLQDRPGHRRVAARLVHQQRAQLVAVVEEPLPALEHRRAREHADAAGDHPGRHPLGVRVDGMEDTAGTHVGQPRPAANAASVASRTAFS